MLPTIWALESHLGTKSLTSWTLKNKTKQVLKRDDSSHKGQEQSSKFHSFASRGPMPKQPAKRLNPLLGELLPTCGLWKEIQQAKGSISWGRLFMCIINMFTTKCSENGYLCWSRIYSGKKEKGRIHVLLEPVLELAEVEESVKENRLSV